MTRSITWWEKTVEYKFIVDHLDYERFISPLDGKHEKAGDAIVGEEGGFALIEFKRSKEDLDSEEQKYKNFQEAKKEFEGEDDMHFLVYGCERESQLELEACTYFSKRGIELDTLFDNRISTKQFCEYVNKLCSYKKASSSSNNTSGGFGSVAVIQQGEHMCRCMSIEEFCIEFEVDLGKPLSSPDMDMN
jgi:hypothetical protein